MIATILPSSTTFHAVDYNERKVSEGVAELLEMENFGFIGRVDSYTPEQLKQYLTKYTYRHNQRGLWRGRPAYSHLRPSRY